MTKRNHLKNRLSFFIMSLEFRLRDRLHPPLKLLREVGVRSGMRVVDFGCGPGSFTLAAARIVGPEGLVYAVDIDPLALGAVWRSAAKRGLENIRTIAGGQPVDVPQGTIDVALLYDVLHELSEPAVIVAELARILKPEGVISVGDHHLKEQEIAARINGAGFDGPTWRIRRTFQFKKNESDRPGV